jgi:hypothetical protein
MLIASGTSLRCHTVTVTSMSRTATTHFRKNVHHITSHRNIKSMGSDGFEFSVYHVRNSLLMRVAWLCIGTSGLYHLCEYQNTRLRYLCAQAYCIKKAGLSLDRATHGRYQYKMFGTGRYVVTLLTQKVLGDTVSNAIRSLSSFSCCIHGGFCLRDCIWLHGYMALLRLFLKGFHFQQEQHHCVYVLQLHR